MQVALAQLVSLWKPLSVIFLNSTEKNYWNYNLLYYFCDVMKFLSYSSWYYSSSTEGRMPVA